MNLLVMPVLIPLMAASICLLLWSRPHLQKGLSFAATLATFVSICLLFWQVLYFGPMSISIGGWAAPIGINLVADALTVIMLLVCSLVGVCVHFYALMTSNPEIEKYGHHPLMQTLFVGVYGSFLTGDVFNLYVCFEIMLISSFVLLALNNGKLQIEGALKYMALNLFGSFMFLAGIGLLYGMAGTVNMADLSVKLSQLEDPAMATNVSMLFLMAFGLKAAAFPFFSWLPASYHTPPSAISAIFAGLLTKVGVYTVMRFFSLIFNQNIEFTHEVILWMGVATMVAGIIGAVGQYDIRKILSFHIVSQIGYMLIGFGMWTELAVAGAIFYLVHNIIAKTNLFLAAGVINRLQGSYHLDYVGGIYRSRPYFSLLFLISALGLAGIPPLSGFFAKILLIKGGLLVGQPIVVGLMVFVGLFTLISMIKIFEKAFWKPLKEGVEAKPLSGGTCERTIAGMNLPIFILAVAVVLMGVFAPIVFELCRMAAAQMLDPTLYIQAVLGGRI